MALLEWLGYCKHKWEIIDDGSIVNKDQEKIGHYYTMQCTHCGEVIRKNHYSTD